MKGISCRAATSPDSLEPATLRLSDSASKLPRASVLGAPSTSVKAADLGVHLLWSMAALIGLMSSCAFAQQVPKTGDASELDDAPTADPGGFDIQRPRVRLLGMVTVGAGHEYRDRLLSDRNFYSLSGGVAHMGFSASAVKNWEVSTGKASHEVLLGYSYKLPFFDVHAGYVACGNDYMPYGCPDAARLTLTTNALRKTMIEASFDRGLTSSSDSISASVTRDLWSRGATSGAIRAGWTRTNYGDSTHLEGTSIRLIASRRVGEHLSIDLAAGSIRTKASAQLPGARDGVFASTSLVWRY